MMNEILIDVAIAVALALWLWGMTAGLCRYCGKSRERVNLSRFHSGYFAQKQFFGKLK